LLDRRRGYDLRGENDLGGGPIDLFEGAMRNRVFCELVHKGNDRDATVFEGSNKKSGFRAAGDGILRAIRRGYSFRERVNLGPLIFSPVRKADHSCRFCFESGIESAAAPQQDDNIVTSLEVLNEVPSYYRSTGSRSFVGNEENGLTVRLESRLRQRHFRCDWERTASFCEAKLDVVNEPAVSGTGGIGVPSPVICGVERGRRRVTAGLSKMYIMLDGVLTATACFV
jgi:hypothetical protein